LELRAVEDPDPKVKRQLWAEAARKPALIADYIERWGAARPADDVCISELKSEHGFTDEQRGMRVIHPPVDPKSRRAISGWLSSALKIKPRRTAGIWRPIGARPENVRTLFPCTASWLSFGQAAS
jgi:hypothetical protein